nr:neural Wiskott-Aldrich syndrome protein-like isoform X1 [Pogona vitticeps]XP_020652356.1 neural Wiskott-Aldrich syndrome protein-like isoform X2 [Pogona vitticeps]
MRSPNCRVSPSSYCISQILYDRIKWRGKPERNQLSKHFIGSPINFKHLCHVEWSPQTGFATNLDPELKVIFAEAGITEDHLKDKRTSKKIFRTIEKRGGVETVLKEAKTKGLLTKSLDHPLLCSVPPTELGFIYNPQNEPDYQGPSSVHGLNNVPAEPFPTPKACSADIPSVVISPVPSTSLLKRSSQHSLIQNLKEAQLKRASSDNSLTPFKQDALMYQIRGRTQLKQVSHKPASPSNGGIVAALKDVIQKRHKAMHVSDNEESDVENGDEWDD